MVDSNHPLAMKALIDCGTMGEFIDHMFVQAHELQTYQLPRLIGLYNADGLLQVAPDATQLGILEIWKAWKAQKRRVSRQWLQLMHCACLLS